MSQLLRFKLRGNLPSGEIFEHGLYCHVADGILMPAIMTRLQSAAAALLTTANGMQLSYTQLTKWGSIELEMVDPTTGKTTTSTNATINYIGSNVNNSLPCNLAIVTTLRTAVSSRTTRGRFYLPATAVDSTTLVGRIIAQTTTRIKVSLNAYFAALKAGGSAQMTPVVYSLKNKSTSDITRYDVGDVFDQQGSRRNKLVESRTGATI